MLSTRSEIPPDAQHVPPVVRRPDRPRSIWPRAFLNWRERRFYARYGEVELHILEYLCDPARDAIDVGANLGSYVNFLRSLSRRVIAFEPIPWLVERLETRFGDQIDVRGVALSNAQGSATLRVPVGDGIDIEGCATIDVQAALHYLKHHEIGVQRERLDDIYDGDAGFIKIDTEGHEEAVLEGASLTIARSRPRLLVEVVDYLAPGGVGRIVAFFEQLGYVGHFIYRRELLPISAFKVDVMQASEDEPDLTAPLSNRERFPRFVYNFLFFPEEEPRSTFEHIRTRIAQL